MKNPVLISLLLVFATSFFCHAQKKSFDLQQLLKEQKLITFGRNVVPITDGDKKGISLTGIAWLKDVSFSTGTIEVDLRGKDVLQQSFIGIVFHGVDTATHDVVYFRPFNFRSQDPVRKIHAVQYASHPDFPWHKLREEKNGIYEKGIDPPPAATDWVHARIVVDDKQIKVYVHNVQEPSLTVDKLNTRQSGLIGLWNEGLDGDFANLTISK
ncbi:MAG TPA: hypothetical protein VN763_14520 [Saprospiraceae bacterium]|nr:hypothetical protein [Saprospiraceae bacterium]